MGQEFEAELSASFPFMKRETTPSAESVLDIPPSDNLYVIFGCEVGDGWFSLLYDLCKEITAAYDKAGVTVNLVPTQIKEKYGTLRFYYEYDSGKNTLPQEETDKLYAEIAHIVSKYEDMSASVCECCGMKGKLRNDHTWLTTLCDKCWESKR